MVDDEQLEEEGERRRREILNRRPSFKKILNDLGAQPETMDNIDEEPTGPDGSGPGEGDVTGSAGSSGQPASVYQGNVVLSSGAQIQIAAHGDGGGSGLQTLTMSNSSGGPVATTPSSTATSGAGGGGVSAAVGSAAATIVQYTAQGPDGQQYIIPGVPPYTIPGAGAVGGVMTAAAPVGLTQQQEHSAEAARKRELRLLKNRDAAKECRRKKKEYIKCLENRVAVLENQNRTLMEELKALKDLYCNSKE